MASYKRTIYLVDPKFQIKFAFFVTSLVFLSSLIYPLFIYETFQRLALEAKGAGLEEMSLKIAATEGNLVQLLLIFQFIFTALVFVICIFQGHKIAGPLYKLKKFFKAIREGNSQEKLVFRKGDNFKDVADDYNAAMEVINNKNFEASQKLDDLSNLVSNQLNSSEDSDKEFCHTLLKKISEIQSLH